jgi:ZIP family zinc transporter
MQANVFHLGPKLNAVLMAVGAGLLLSSVACDLMKEVLKLSSLLLITDSCFLGPAAFMLGDMILDRMGAAQRKGPKDFKGTVD